MRLPVDISQQVEFRQITCADTSLLLEGYALLQETMGTESVEDLRSFMATVSPETDRYVCPILVCALGENEMIGITLGMYMRNLKMGFIAYSGVKDAWRRRGIYGSLRNELVRLLDRASCDANVPSRYQTESSNVFGVRYVVSELDCDGWLYDKYVCDWGAYPVLCDYEQPEVQGLRGKPMKLVMQPASGMIPPEKHEIAHIVYEVYGRIYRIAEPEANPAFQRIVASIAE